MKDKDPMPFGKYKGRRMEDVPAAYLDWLIDQAWIDSWPDVVRYINANLDIIHSELEESNA